MALDKKVYADGAVIFREGEAGAVTLEIISGTVDLLIKRDGKYTRARTVAAGNILGMEADTKGGIRLYTARANGRVVLRPTQTSALVATQGAANVAPMGLLNRLLQTLTSKSPVPHGGTAAVPSYSNPGLLRRLMDGMSTDADRIGIRVARLSGIDGDKHTRHLISAIGNTGGLQTRSIEKVLTINPEADLRKQLDRLSSASRRYLKNQDADLLVWGHVPEQGNVMHLHFVSHVNWDQQVPGAFDLATTLALPTDVEGPLAELLRAVCLSAALPTTPAKEKIRSSALLAAIRLAEGAFEQVPTHFSDREKACLYLCYGNAISAAARPGYDPALLSQAAQQFRFALGNLSRDAMPNDWAQAKKHLASINHIEAERNGDTGLLETAKTELEDALGAMDPDRHRAAWGSIQNRLGLIYYRQGFDEGDTRTLRRALKCFQSSLRVYTRTESPLRWADIMSSFAQATQVLGGLLQSPDALATAVNACRSVLEVRDRTRTPKAWAASQNNLGSALFLLGKQTRSVERLEASVAAFEQALEIYQMYGGQRLALTTAKNLDRAKDMVDAYQPRNSTQLDWQEALSDGVVSRQTEFDEFDKSDRQKTTGDDKLPWPGEGLQQQIG